MQSADIPPEVVRFVSAHIDTVPHLEVLLLLAESAPKQWSVVEIASRAYVDRTVAGRITADLRRRGLIDCSNAEEGWHFVPDTEAAPLVALTAQTYRKQLIQLTRLIHAKGSPAMQEFARAFQFKNER